MIALLPRETWRRNQLVVCVAVFMVFTGFAFVLPFLPLYVRELGVASDEAAATWAGVLIGVAPLLAGLLAPVWGRLGDRYGQKPMAVRALVSYVILLALSGAVTTVWQLLALRTAVGLFGGVGPLGLAMATALAPRDQTGRAVGSIQSAQILAAAVGPLAGRRCWPTPSACAGPSWPPPPPARSPSSCSSSSTKRRRAWPPPKPRRATGSAHVLRRARRAAPDGRPSSS